MGRPRGTCSIEGCDRPHFARTWCSKHWHRWRRYGDPTSPGQRPSTDLDRFRRWVQPTGFCWEWTGTLTTGGYGALTVGGQYLAAHRWSYERLVGPIPDGLQLDHLCRNRACVNPDHLEPVTRAENLRRGVQGYALRRQCAQGHPITDESGVVFYGGRRRCRECVEARFSKERTGGMTDNDPEVLATAPARPTREQIARALREGRTNGLCKPGVRCDLCDCTQEYEDDLALRDADAVLALLTDQPTEAEAGARARDDLLAYLIDDFNRQHAQVAVDTPEEGYSGLSWHEWADGTRNGMEKLIYTVRYLAEHPEYTERAARTRGGDDQ